MSKPCFLQDQCPIVEELSRQIGLFDKQIADLTTTADRAERVNALNSKIIDEYQNVLIPGFRERAERVEAQAKLLYDMALPLYNDLHGKYSSILTDNERRAYALAQAIVGGGEVPNA